MHGMRGVQGIRGEAACSGPAGTGPGSGCGDAPGQRRRQADDQRTEPVQHASGGACGGEDVATPPRPLFQIRSIKPATLTKKPSNKIQGGPQIAQRGRIEVLEGVDGGKRQPHLARGDADHGGDLEQLEADGGALRLGHGRPAMPTSRTVFIST